MSVPGPNGHVNIRYGAGPGKARVHVNNSRPAFPRLHHKAKRHRMAFGHIRAFNDDDVRVHQVAWECAWRRPCRTWFPNWAPLRSVKYGPDFRSEQFPAR